SSPLDVSKKKLSVDGASVLSCWAITVNVPKQTNSMLRTQVHRTKYRKLKGRFTHRSLQMQYRLSISSRLESGPFANRCFRQFYYIINCSLQTFKSRFTLIQFAINKERGHIPYPQGK